MSSNTLIRSIGSTGGLGFGQGFISIDHQLPNGYEVRHLKTCENCNALFTTRVSYGQKIEFKSKYCPLCIARMLLPEDHITNYKEAFPTGAKMDKSTRVPHYDSSLGVKTLSAKKMKVKRASRLRPEGWFERLMAAFDEKQALSLVEVAEAMQVKARPCLIVQLRALKIMKAKIVECGSIWPRPSSMGKVPRIYRLVAL